MRGQADERKGLRPTPSCLLSSRESAASSPGTRSLSRNPASREEQTRGGRTPSCQLRKDKDLALTGASCGLEEADPREASWYRDDKSKDIWGVRIRSKCSEGEPVDRACGRHGEVWLGRRR